MHKIIARGRLCVLADMQNEYLPKHTEGMNDPEVHRFILSRPPFTVARQEEWLQKMKDTGQYIFAILVSSDTSPEDLFFVGVMELSQVDLKKRSALSGSVISDKAYWKRGIAREARLLQLDFAFNEIGLKFVYSKTMEPNVRSQRLLESTGYRLTGRLPKVRELDGILCDELHYRVSRTGWMKAKKQYISSL